MAHHVLGVNPRAARVTRGLLEVEHVVLLGHWFRCVHGAVRQDAGQDSAAPTEQGIATLEPSGRAISSHVHSYCSFLRDTKRVRTNHGVSTKKPLSYRHLLMSLWRARSFNAAPIPVPTAKRH